MDYDVIDKEPPPPPAGAGEKTGFVNKAVGLLEEITRDHTKGGAGGNRGASGSWGPEPKKEKKKAVQLRDLTMGR